MIDAPRGTITTELRAALVALKPEILALLRSGDQHAEAPPGPSTLPPSWREVVAHLDPDRWVRWRRHSGEIQLTLGHRPTVEEIHAADRQAAAEILGEIEATGAGSGQAIGVRSGHRFQFMGKLDDRSRSLSRQDPIVAAYLALAILGFLSLEKTQEGLGFVAAMQKAAAKIQEAAG